MDLTKMKKFRRTLNKSDFGLTTNITLDTNNFIKIGSLKVPAQQIITFGATEMIAGQPQGATCYIDLKDTSNAAVNGIVRLAVANATETDIRVVLEERAEKLRASQYDRTLAVLLPESIFKAKQDSFLFIYLKSDASGTLSAANTTYLVPVTVYY